MTSPKVATGSAVARVSADEAGRPAAAWAAAWAAASARGSRMVSASNAMSSPGSPTQKKTVCHGCMAPTSGSVMSPGASTRPTTYAPNAYATPDPANVPTMYVLMAVPSCRRGNWSAMMDTAAGPRVASPTPTPTRATNSWPKVRAMPVAAVMRLHTATPSATMRGRMPRSTHRPMGSPSTE